MQKFTGSLSTANVTIVRCAIFIVLLFPAFAQSQTRDPYEVTWGRDLPIMGGSLAIAFIASSIDDSLTIPTETQIATLDKNTINGFDRWATDFSSKGVSSVSDVLVGACLASPVIMTFVDGEMRDDMWTIGTMYFETALLATFLPSFGKGSVERYRPYSYNPDTEDDLLYSNETHRSFFSGHATWAFASSTFFASVYSDYYPDSDYKTTVWITSMSAASAVALLRVFSGAHFPTDVLVGATVGFGVGYLIPWLHKTSPMNVGLAPTMDGGLNLGFRGRL